MIWKKVEEWGKDEKFKFEAYTLFNEALFLQIPRENDLLNNFAEIISEKREANYRLFHFENL